MATKKVAATAAETETVEEKAEQATDWMQDRVTIRLPRAAKGEANYEIAGVNGYMVKIMRGVDVEVPRAIAAVLEDSRKARDYADGYDQDVSN